MRLQDARVAVVGLGLMGGSLGACLKAGRSCREVWGVARRPETVAEAVARECIDGGTTELASGVQGADIVVLATPVRSILKLIPQVAPLLPSSCLLMDLGSTKAAIVEAMERAVARPSPEEGLQALGGHPMCGKEAAGIEAADANLYRGARFVLTPLASTTPEGLALATELVEALGARPLIMEAHRHDRLVAVVSHLPYLVALALVCTAEEYGLEDDAVWELAASGFRDTSRLAGSDVRMMLDILFTNTKAEIDVLERVRQTLHELLHLVESGDELALREAMEAAQRRRSGMFTMPVKAGAR